MKSFSSVLILLVLTTFLVSSCFVPRTKESYLVNFERFVKDVEKNSSKFEKKDWKWAQIRYENYAGSWYNKFENEFSLSEKLQITALKARYEIVRQGSEIGRILDGSVRKEFEKLGKDVEKYLDENLDKDVEKVVKGAREIGDSAVKAVQKALDEAKKK